MDYVPAHGDTAKRDDREDISGARCFDGEDQGKSKIYQRPNSNLNYLSESHSTIRSLTLLLEEFSSFCDRYKIQSDFDLTFQISIGYGNRLRMQQLQQTDFINQQIRVKEL